MRYKTPLLAALLLLLGGIPTHRFAADYSRLWAQTEDAEFPLPDSVAANTSVRVASSPSMAAVSQVLKTQFESRYDGTAVGLSPLRSSDEALAALVAGEAEVAAIGRPLTEAEQAQGIAVVPIEREKIAIVTGSDSDFDGGLTFEQFARMFRGEITDWAEVGGAAGAIRFIDRPDSSDTRRALSQYEVFLGAPFETGATATQLAEDDTAAVIEALGADGVSYAIATHVLDTDGVKIIPMHGTLPDDPRYPYSQPRYFAYTDAASPAVQALLGYATAPVGAAAIAEADLEDALAATGAAETAAGTEATAGATAPEEATAGAVADATAPAAGEAGTAGAEGAEGAAPAETSDEVAVATEPASEEAGAAWLWWLLPLALLGGAAAWGLTRRRQPGAGTAPAAGGSDPLDPATTPQGAVPASETAAAAGLGTARMAAGTAGLGAGAASATGAAAEGGLPPEPPEPPMPAAPPVDPADGIPPAMPTVPAADPANSIAAESVSPAADAPVSGSLGAAGAAGAAGLAAGLAGAGADSPAVGEEDAIATPTSDPPETSPEQIDPVPAPDPAPAPATLNGMSVPGGVAGLAGAAGLAAGAAAAMASTEDQSVIEASKFDVIGHPADGEIDLSGVDDGLPELPGGYGESRIVLMPRDPQWAYAYWDTPNSHKEALRRQGGRQLALRLYDVTDIDLNTQVSYSLQQYDCDELARSWYLPLPVSDRDYVAEIGYLTADGRWLMLARSQPVRVPPVYPSDWVEDHFLTVDWSQDLRGGTLMALVPPHQRLASEANPIYESIFSLAQSAEAQRVAGSLYGSMQHVPGSMVPQQSLSSYVMPSGMGLIGVAGMEMGAVPTPSGLTMSGLNMSGAGFFASAPPPRPRKFWLVADAELIVYGATEPDATVTIGGEPIQLQPDGTFRFHMSFQDGNIDYPIMAVAADGEQSRSVHMTFDRETPQRNTNTREEAQEEWL